MEFDQIIDSLEMIKEDVGIPKNLKLKIDKIKSILNNKDEEIEIRTHKAGVILDEISNDSSIQPFIRTQIYQIVSLL